MFDLNRKNVICAQYTVVNLSMPKCCEIRSKCPRVSLPRRSEWASMPNTILLAGRCRYGTADSLWLGL